MIQSDIETAKRIATECGILDNNGIVMEGKEFRNLKDSADNFTDVLRRVRVVARSTPTDKKLFVER